MDDSISAKHHALWPLHICWECMNTWIAIKLITVICIQSVHHWRNGSICINEQMARPVICIYQTMDDMGKIWKTHLDTCLRLGDFPRRAWDTCWFWMIFILEYISYRNLYDICRYVHRYIYIYIYMLHVCIYIYVYMYIYIACISYLSLCMQIIMPIHIEIYVTFKFIVTRFQL